MVHDLKGYKDYIIITGFTPPPYREVAVIWESITEKGIDIAAAAKLLLK